MIRSSKIDRLQLISDDIERVGYHITVVQQERVPSFAYTIGLRNSVEFELILAGGSIFLFDELIEIINSIAGNCKKSGVSSSHDIKAGSHGAFALRRSHASWVEMLMLGAIDFFDDPAIETYQIRPDSAHITIDVPDLAVAWSPQREPAWRWLRESWELPIPSTSTALTNLAALRGERITEASRWELDEWELFAGSGPDTPSDEVRVVPIGTLLAVDGTLESVISLDVGKSLWRDADDMEWNDW